MSVVGRKGVVDMPPADGHAVDTETMMVLYGLVRYLKPALVVEAGTYKGHAACTMALAMRDGEIDGEVWTADIADYGAAATVAANGLDSYVHAFAGDFGDMLAGPLAGRLARLAFVDSGMAVGTAVPDVPTNIRMTHATLAYNHLLVGGLLVMDDCSGEWDGLSEWLSRADILLPKGRGMAIVQRR